MKQIHLPTLIAITIVAWPMVNIAHETLGHAGFGLLSGFQIKAVNTTTAYLDADWEKEITQNGFNKFRIFLIGGVLLNLVTGTCKHLLCRIQKMKECSIVHHPNSSCNHHNSSNSIHLEKPFCLLTPGSQSFARISFCLFPSCNWVIPRDLSSIFR